MRDVVEASVAITIDQDCDSFKLPAYRISIATTAQADAERSC